MPRATKLGGTDAFWRGQRVLVTGHTGFKGVWLTLWLERLGAIVIGLALPPASQPSLYALAGPWNADLHRTVDVRDAAAVRHAIDAARPDVVFHLAAQALVRPAYREPVATFATNVLGTVHVLEAIRHCPSVRAVVIVTTDKVYENHEAGRPFVETDRLGGKDPYSCSKACAELATQCYIDSLCTGPDCPAVATARAGNVIGGGDWSADRLIPDVIRARTGGGKVQIRYPSAVRPWQHVLEPLAGYLLLARKLVEAPTDTPHAFNFGPDPGSFLTVAEVLDMVGEAVGGAGWEPAPGEQPPEAQSLTLASDLAQHRLGWTPRLTIAETIAWTAQWYCEVAAGAPARSTTLAQIAQFEARLQ